MTLGIPARYVCMYVCMCAQVLKATGGHGVCKVELDAQRPHSFRVTKDQVSASHHLATCAGVIAPLEARPPVVHRDNTLRIRVRFRYMYVLPYVILGHTRTCTVQFIRMVRVASPRAKSTLAVTELYPLKGPP